MFDIFVYLFENYVHAAAWPEAEQLARKLSAAGFEDDEISEALEWLSGLREVSSPAPMASRPGMRSIRLYAPEEAARLNPECRGFLAFLENAGALDGATRELIIERTLALSGRNVSLRRFKVVVLMVLWQLDRPLEGLILDELLSLDDDEALALLH